MKKLIPAPAPVQSSPAHRALPKGVALVVGAPRGSLEAVEKWFSNHGRSVAAAAAHNQARREAGYAPILEVRR